MSLTKVNDAVYSIENENLKSSKQANNQKIFAKRIISQMLQTN